MVVRLLPLKDSLRLSGRGKDWTLQVMVRLSLMTTTRGAVEMVKLGAAGGEVVGSRGQLSHQNTKHSNVFTCSAVHKVNAGKHSTMNTT